MKIFIAKIFRLCSKDKRNFSEFIMLFRVGTKELKNFKNTFTRSSLSNLLWTAKICKFLEKRSQLCQELKLGQLSDRQLSLFTTSRSQSLIEITVEINILHNHSDFHCTTKVREEDLVKVFFEIFFVFLYKFQCETFHHSLNQTKEIT